MKIRNSDKIHLAVSIGLLIAFLFPEHQWLSLASNYVWLWINIKDGDEV